MRIGLISDTHMPQRWPALPDAVERLFAGVDLILHAGDVGQLWVLDELSKLGPVVAVHGNDETEEAQRELPYQQLLALDGRRVLLWHSHYRERAMELANRQDRWEPILDRLAARARRAGAEIVVYGHTHVPMALGHGGVLLVNPGAIASGNFLRRQTRQTLALMEMTVDAMTVRHVDVAAPDEAYEARVDLAGGFGAALARYEESILAPELRRRLPGLRPDMFADAEAVLDKVLPLAHEVWAGKRRWVTEEALREALGDADWKVVAQRMGDDVGDGGG